MSKFQPTPQQERAFRSVITAIKRAQKQGLRFYGKSDSLVAYTSQAADYAVHHDYSTRGYTQIECLVASVLQDSGADDYPKYISAADYNEFR